MISKIYAGTARCLIFSICLICFLLGAVLAVQSARHQVFLEVFLRTIDPSYSFNNCLAVQSGAATVLIVIAGSSYFGVLTPHPKWFPWALPWAFLCSLVAAMLYLASGKLKLDTAAMFNNNQQRANFIHVFPTDCVVLQPSVVRCPNMGNMYCEPGTLTPAPDEFANASTVWDSCANGWTQQLESVGNDGALLLVIVASLLWAATIAGLLCILVVKRTIWRKTFASQHDQVFHRLVAEWVENGEQILCVAEKDLHHADLETLRFLGIAAISIVGLPLAILFLPVYLEYKRREYVETVLFLTTRRLLLKNGNQPNSISCKLGAILNLHTISSGTLTRLCMGSDGIKIKMKQAHVLRGMPSCDTLLLTGIKNADEFLQRWKCLLKDETQEGNRCHTRTFSSESIDVSDYPSESHLDFSFSGEVDDAQCDTHSYWTSHRKLQSGLPEILCITKIPSAEVQRRWNISRETILSVQLQFEGTTWVVYRRPTDFISLHVTLISKLRLRGNWMQNFPKLPKRYWTKLAPREVDDMDDILRSMLHAYLDECFKIPVIRDSVTFANFVEVSTFSFRGNLGVAKLREGNVWKLRRNGVCSLCRTYLARLPLRCFNLATCRAQLCKRWMILRQDHLIFMENQRASTNKDVLMFDYTMSVTAGRKETGYDDGLYINTQDGDWTLRCGSALQASLWKEAIEVAMRKSPFCEIQPYGSTFPPRQECSVELLCDGKPYFQAVYEALDEAETDIYICDWWLTPEVPLLRDTKEEVEQSRLVKILRRKADAGVKVFIHVYKEMPMLYMDSSYMKEELGKHDNISFLRHPDHLPFSEGKMIWLWSHHEKLICVDQTIAFIGGMDLCWGRYDTDKHHIYDFGGDGPAQFPGKDYHNPRIKDFTDVRLAEIDLINRNVDPRMPWHDVGIRLEGPVVSDIARHFLQLWNHVIRDKDERNVRMRKDEPYVRQPSDATGEAGSRPSFITHARDMGDRIAAFGKKVHRRGRRALAHMTSFDEETPFYDPNANRPATCIELPRSNVGKCTREDLSGPLLQPFTRQSDDDASSPLADTPPGDGLDALKESPQSEIRTQLSDRRRSPSCTLTKRGISDTSGDLEEAKGDLDSPSLGSDARPCGSPFYPQLRPRHASSSQRFARGVHGDDVQVQLLRQCSTWSYGTNDCSVHECYRRLIAAAKNYIYIENQFFITSTHRSVELGNGLRSAQNRVGQVIVDRILQACQRGEDFRVYIMLPALPGFEGADLRSVESYTLRYTMQMQFLSICRGPNSIIGTLEDELPRCGFSPSTWHNHIGFFCLKHAETMPNKKFQAEQIYIHSKVMIVDDEKMICGSANINDRSLIGGRDSETCVLVTHKEFVTQARTRLWHEHFGLLGGDDMPCNAKDIEVALRVPQSIAAWTLWHTFGKSNAASIFDNCAYWPSNEITTFDQWQLTVNRNLARAPTSEECHVQHFGRVSDFPCNFLVNENILLPAPLTASVAPCDLIFT